MKSVDYDQSNVKFRYIVDFEGNFAYLANRDSQKLGNCFYQKLLSWIFEPVL